MWRSAVSQPTFCTLCTKMTRHSSVLHAGTAIFIFLSETLCLLSTPLRTTHVVHATTVALLSYRVLCEYCEYVHARTHIDSPKMFYNSKSHLQILGVKRDRSTSHTEDPQLCSDRYTHTHTHTLSVTIMLLGFVQPCYKVHLFLPCR